MDMPQGSDKENLMTHRTKLAVVAVAVASLARAAWSASVDSAPKLDVLSAPALAAPSAALPSLGGLSAGLGASSISEAAAPAPGVQAARVEAPIPAAFAALPQGQVSRTVAALQAAVSDHKGSAATIGRAFTGGGYRFGEIDGENAD